MKIKIFVILYCLFLFSINLGSQNRYPIIENTPLKFEKLNPEDGLIHNSITSIFQDSKGYMWFGSFNGLYKYDGYNYKIYINELENNRSLIGNDILTLAEDKNGTLWVGTTQGLCRYNRSTDDFSRSLPAKNEDLFIENKIFAIYQDSFNTVWVGTDNGLYQIGCEENNYDAVIHQSDGSSQGLSFNSVKTIIEDKYNNLWVGTKKGLNRVSINRQGKPVFKQFLANSNNKHAISNNFITSSYIDDNDNLWVGTKNGLNKLILSSGENKTTFTQFFNDRNNKNSLANNYITAISQDDNKDLWIGTRYGGASRYSQGKFSTFQKNLGDNNSLSSNEVSSIFNGKYGVLWIGVIAGRVNKLDLNKKEIAHYKFNALDKTSLSDNIVNVIYEDSKKNIWIGTHNGGINKLIIEEGKTIFKNLNHDPINPNSLSSNNVFSFCEDNHGNYWIGTEDQGLNHVKLPKNKTLKKAKILRHFKETGAIPSNNISILMKDHLGDIWMGSFDGDGLMKFTPNQFGDTFPKVNHYKHQSLDENSISSDYISSIYEDSKNRLWIGTFGAGLMRIERDSNNNPTDFLKIKSQIKNPNSLSNDNIFSITESKDGAIWIATFGGGLNKIEEKYIETENPHVIRFGAEHGLTNQELYGILEDSNENLWLSSNKGIYKFNRKEERFTNFQTSDGFQALNFRKFSYFKGDNGLMYFGGINGFNVFKPESVKPNNFKPNVQIVDLKIFNESVGVNQEISGESLLKNAITETDSIELHSSINNFTLEFSGLHYASPKQNKYQYKLEGFDQFWNQTDASRRYATYSNLDAGVYKFKVKASNNDLIWNETPDTLIIKIHSPWWRTWWAYLIYFSIIVGLMFLFRHFITKNNEYQSKLKIERIEQENLKKLNSAKLEFFTNISHELKTPLTLILGPLQHLIDADSIDFKVKNTLTGIERNAKNLYKLINQVLEFRRIENNESQISLSEGDLSKFIEEIVNSFYFLALERKIKLTFNSNKSNFHTLFDWDKLEKIINNLISNCIKYTPKQGKIDVSLHFTNTLNGEYKVEIMVEDTGIGIPKNQLALIFNRFYQINKSNRSSSMGSGIGLALTKALVKLHHGDITVKSKESEGSKFIITFPLTVTQTEGNSFEKIQNKVTPLKQLDELHPNEALKTLDPPVEKDNITKDKPLLLLVEDNFELQKFICDSLKETYQIIQAFDGEAGIKMAIEHVPDIIISDIMMPKKDGIELCDNIKRNFVTNHIPLILLSARSSIEHRIEGLEVGADSYISKPFHVKHLKVALRELLKQRALLKEKFSLGSNHVLEGSNNTNKFETAFLEKIESIIAENMNNTQFGVTELGEALNFSRMQLYRKLKSISGMAANEFIREFRIKQAAKYIKETDMNISEIAYDVGFNNLSYFTKCFKQVYKTSPSKYAKEHRKTFS
ncbi:hybrid sensor histidine kinase/response regulator transcription factor [uncultured Algibacter sp.]|uniref:hybrid sensor histidine kinase/response regulator transcription factor n=1 Tax=uncultured Algibacter sp. TaxID=298659 RepID=UPI002604D0D7|nr:hybrid sensor histidine kinase/response regulator transcription factor [uncultured Algibacter sp.]